MIPVPLAGSTVFVTGGTRGLGKAIGVECARARAAVFLTHRWETVGGAELHRDFAAAGLPRPHGLFRVVGQCLVEGEVRSVAVLSGF